MKASTKFHIYPTYLGLENSSLHFTIFRFLIMYYTPHQKVKQIYCYVLEFKP